MSTAIMAQNTLYEFGESMMKIKGNNDQCQPTSPHITVNNSAMRYALTRMASTPANATSAATAVSLVSSFLNLQQQQQQQHRRLERTQSAPAPTAAALQSASVNTSRYKTELCRPYEEFGVCKYGEKCQFAHGMAELRSLTRHPKYKTELCRTYHTVGFCPYGPRCHFVHNQDEVIQHNRAVSAALVVARAQSTRPRPSALSPSLSLDSPSSPCSLSQSPTSSLGSFFSSEPELHSPDDQRLPVFNRLSANPLIALREIRDLVQ